VKNGEVKHEKFEQIKTCVENNIPVFLLGPAGSGKNHTLEQIAKELDLDFYFTNSIQQEYKLTGFIDAGGTYHETEFYKAFTKGGLFFLDEMDASIPEVLVLLNAAIANKYFEFPNGKVTAHEGFRVVSAGNTVGNGADENYTGRMTLDQATLDRFAIIHFDYSKTIELHLAKGNTELVEFVENLRAQAKNKGVRATFSYRCITMVEKLEGKLALTEILAIAIFKGMDKDTVNTFRPELINNKYCTALRQVQAN
jgi:MoxR-like ATPase